MKGKHFLPVLLFVPSLLLGQVFNSADLDIGNIRARFSSDGELFYDGNTWMFEAPKGSGKKACYAGHLWIGGKDASGIMHVAAQDYRYGADYFQGPMMTPSNYSSAQDALWNRVWKINKSTIDSFRLGLFTNTPQIILDWPGNGNVSLGQAAQLAPYKDVNNDNIYNPANGDFPCIKGDQAVYMIFNDDRNLHTESGGIKLGLEIHAMAYAFKDTIVPHLKNAVFLNYRIINRSSNNYSNTWIGMWNDQDLGIYDDDFIGSNVEKNFYFAFNGDNMDWNGSGWTYGINPPALGTVFLKGPPADIGDGIDNNHNCFVDELGECHLLSKFMYYTNDGATVTGNPVCDTNHYTFLQGLWKDSLPLTYGSDGYNEIVPCSYMFPGSSDQTIAWGTGGNCQTPATIEPIWDEMSEGNFPSNRRGIGSSGPFTFFPNQEICLDYAFVFARGTNGNLSSVTLLESAVDTIRNFYSSMGLDSCGCVVTPVGIQELVDKISINLYPNPSINNLYIQLSSSNQLLSIEVFDLSGRSIKAETPKRAGSTIEISTIHFPAGIYLLKVETKEGAAFRKFVKE